MILTVTLNAALDVSYTVDHLSDGEPVRVRAVSTRPGGKGVNVAFVLAALGTEVTATGFAGGHRGQQLREALTGSGITDAFVPIASESRQTVVALADDGTFAEYDEPGTMVSGEEWEGFLAEYCRLMESCSTVVCAGSLPGGVPAGAYATLVSAARERGRTVLLDAGGEALRAGLESKPDIVKVNRAELAGLAGRELTDDAAVIGSAEAIGGIVVVTLGSGGAIATGDGWRYRVRPPQRRGNPVGAGDAFTAALVCDETASAGPAERLAFAGAVAASSVGLVGAGVVDLDVAEGLVDQVKVEAL